MPIDAISNNYTTTAIDKNAADMAAGFEKKTARTSNEDAQKIRQLKETDRKVRAHEAAHVAAGGQYVRGGATFQYQKGPNGKMYAVSGEVSIDASPVHGDPEATIQKMQVVRRAAMAPVDPSGQDRAVAAAASAAEAQARQEVTREKASENEEENKAVVIGSSTTIKSSKTSSYNGKGEVTAFSENDRISIIDLISIN
jgi:hypothetical protein